MTDRDETERVERLLVEAARGFQYPETPDVASEFASLRRFESGPRRVLGPRAAWALLGILIVLSAFLAVPGVRAQVLEFLQVGNLRIRLTGPTPTGTGPEGERTAPGEGSLEVASLRSIIGETSLQDAADRSGFPLMLPGLPADLGAPDRVFYQDSGGEAVVFVWLLPEDPGHVEMSLLQLGPGAFAGKGQPEILEETRVNGNRALWIEGAHTLRLEGDRWQTVPLVVEGRVLVWEQEGVTYRLESDLTLPAAIQVAESLRPVDSNP